MTSIDAKFAGSIPAIYHQYLVPLLFEPYAEDLAARVRELVQGQVIELAAGTGALTQALRCSLAAPVRIEATDLNPGMLAIAKERTSDPSVTWRQADAQKLPMESGSADAIVCQFGVMFFPDRGAAYREVARVLRPGGRFVFNAWDRLERNEVSDIVSRAVCALFPDDPPRFYERTPFGYSDPATIRGELEGAGFDRIEIETVEKVSVSVTRRCEFACSGRVSRCKSHYIG
jgi:ubiquinone/menaquinone biosynthesis C-methylase UbiE